MYRFSQAASTTNDPGHQQDSEQHQHQPRQLLDEREEPPGPRERPQEALEREGGEQKRDREPHRIDEEEEHSGREVLLGRGHRHDRAEDGADARCPPRAEGDSDGDGADVPGGLVRQVDALLPQERDQLEHAHQVQPEEDDDDAPDARDPIAVGQEEVPDEGRPRSQQHEDQGESGHEERRMGEHAAAVEPLLQVFERHSRHERQVARHQRQDAGRQEGEDARP